MEPLVSWVLALCVCLGFEARAATFDEVFHAWESLSFSEFSVVTNRPLDWKVGDRADFILWAGFLSGRMTTEVVREESEGFWVRYFIKGGGRKETVEKFYRKSDGTVLHVLSNGAEQNPDDSRIEVISAEEAQIAVPAGFFKTVHIVGRTKQVQKLELWLNPVDTVIDGTVKGITNIRGVPITSELKSFKRAP